MVTGNLMSSVLFHGLREAAWKLFEARGASGVTEFARATKTLIFGPIHIGWGGPVSCLESGMCEIMWTGGIKQRACTRLN